MTKKNSNMNSAKQAKNDEFYTRLSDIENELKHYKHHFKDKVVYCNCDDPKVSNFFKYFALNFKHLGLKKLITACYRNTDPNVRTKGVSDKAVWLEYAGGDYNTIEEIRANTVTHEFNGDGDFRSDESIELLKEADIVVSNPPFSLFRLYVAQLIEYDKEFLILGNMNAITYKEIFPLLKDNKMWLGHKNGSMEFELPSDAEMKASGYINEDGIKVQKFGNISWYTNMDISKRHDDLILFKRYNFEEYPQYDNFKAINVDKVVNIPVDYTGVMGVPITFLDKHNPGQFDILGNLGSYAPDGYSLSSAVYIDGVKKFKRILIKHKNPEVPTQ